MISTIYNVFLYEPILNLLIWFYHLVGNDMGMAIIVMTITLRLVMYPLTKPSLEAARKQKELQPQIEKLKKKYKNKQILAQKQMELFKKHGVNPVAGCLPQIAQFIVIIALYRVFTNLLASNGVMISEINSLLYFDSFKFAADDVLNTKFLYLDLANKDHLFILPVLAAASQFFLSKYMMKGSAQLEKLAQDTPEKSDDVMTSMQGQMAYIFPVMTLVIGVNLPSGLVLYWFVSTLIAVAQYYIINNYGSKKGTGKS